jgi:hypothetical protein
LLLRRGFARSGQNKQNPETPEMRIALPLIVSLGMFTTMTSLSLGIGSMLPADMGIPLPLGLGGEPASKPVLLAIMPLAILIATAVFALACKNIGKTARHPERYIILWLAVILLLAVGHGLIIRSALIALGGS